MTRNRSARRRETQHLVANEALARELADKLCAPAKLVVKEERAMVAMRLNLEFVACESVAEVAGFADVVFHHNPAVIGAIHNAIQEGDACVHILLDLGYHLTHSASACDAICQAGIVETLAGVLPMLTTAPLLSALQLLDRITDDNDDDAPTWPTPSSDRRRCRRLAVQRLCRVACVRALWNVLDSDRSSSPLVPLLAVALSLLCKITAVVETTHWASGSAAVAVAAQLVVTHILGRMPPTEATLSAQLLMEDGGHEAGRRHDDPHARARIGELLARVERWLGANNTRSIQ